MFWDAKSPLTPRTKTLNKMWDAINDLEPVDLEAHIKRLKDIQHLVTVYLECGVQSLKINVEKKQSLIEEIEKDLADKKKY